MVGSPSIGEWAEAGAALSRIGGAVQWWLGDWLNYGERGPYGETYAQHIQLTGYDYGTLANYAWVALRIEFSRRREDSWKDAEDREHRITWGHHAAVAPLEPPEQDRLLALAVEKQLGRAELRRAVKEFRSGEFPPWLCYTDVWNIPDCDERFGIEYPGRIPGQIIQNTLYYFAPPGGLVVDPMAGGGTTLDVCKALKFRCIAFDLEPARDDILQADAREPWPVNEPANLIFIDPPYGSQQAEAYGGMAALEPPAFLEEFTRVLVSAEKALAKGGRLAILIAPMAIKTEYVDLPFEVAIRAASLGLRLVRRVSVPVSSQQVGPQVMAACKEKKVLVALLRDLLVFEKGAPQ